MESVHGLRPIPSPPDRQWTVSQPSSLEPGMLTHMLTQLPARDGARDSWPVNTSKGSPWDRNCCRWHQKAEASFAAKPSAQSEPNGLRALQLPGPSTGKRHGCGQRGCCEGHAAAHACWTWLVGPVSRVLVKGRVALYLLCRELDAEACRERLTQITALSGIWALALLPSEAQLK